jgi:hypothetical protein
VLVLQSPISGDQNVQTGYLDTKVMPQLDVIADPQALYYGAEVS